eukprot:scaffold577_cov93-Skeletonema_marinoi.AAC.2
MKWLALEREPNPTTSAATVDCKVQGEALLFSCGALYDGINITALFFVDTTPTMLWPSRTSTPLDCCLSILDDHHRCLCALRLI